MEFEEGNMYLNANEKTRHHEETPSAQKTFAWDVQSLAALTERLGNPFEEECLIYWCSTQSNLMILQLLKQFEKQQFQAHQKYRFIDTTKTIDETWKRKNYHSSRETKDQQHSKERKHL